MSLFKRQTEISSSKDKRYGGGERGGKGGGQKETARLETARAEAVKLARRV